MRRVAERIACPDCHSAGETYFENRNHPGFWQSADCDRCDCEGHVDFDVATLAHNLAIGGALCRAFVMGLEWADAANVMFDVRNAWRPGCGWSAP